MLLLLLLLLLLLCVRGQSTGRFSAVLSVLRAVCPVPSPFSFSASPETPLALVLASAVHAAVTQPSRPSRCTQTAPAAAPLVSPRRRDQTRAGRLAVAPHMDTQAGGGPVGPHGSKIYAVGVLSL